MKTKTLSMAISLAVCFGLAVQSPGKKPVPPDPDPEPTVPISYRSVDFAESLFVSTARLNDYGVIVGTIDLPFPPQGYLAPPSGEGETMEYRDEDIGFFCDTHIGNAFYINNLNQITGSSHVEASDGTLYLRAELWLPEGIQVNLMVAPEKVNCSGIDINDSGMVLISGHTVAGVVLPEDGDGDGLADNWVAENGGINTLFYPVPEGLTPCRINEYGQVLFAEGALLNPDYDVLGQGGNPWQDGNAMLQWLNPLPGELSADTTARDLNDYGEVVGQSGDRAVLWTSPDIPVEIITPRAKGAKAYGINNQRQIIGSYNPTKFSTKYFLVHEDVLYTFEDLTVDGISGPLNQINNAGQILGAGLVYVPIMNQ